MNQARDSPLAMVKVVKSSMMDGSAYEFRSNVTRFDNSKDINRKTPALIG